jgi:hypothetical protein
MKSSDLNNICAQEKQQHIHEFADYCCDKLGIDRPDLTLKGTNDTNALGYTDMTDGSVTIVVADRHQMDIMRTLAHELVHVKQMKSYEPDGTTGSADENEANAMAGVLMREWGQNNPDLYTEGVNVSENTDEARFKFNKPKQSAQDRLNQRAAKHGIGTPDKEKFYADMQKKFQQSMDSKTEKADEGQQCWDGYEKKGTKKMFGKTVNNCVKKESVEQVDESKTARMMALITALGATYGLEDEARAFADQIQQNIHNAQTAEPNPGRPDPVSKGNMMPGSDRVMRPPVDEIAPAIAAVGRGVVKGAGAVAKGVGSMVKTAGTNMAINRMRDEIEDDEANEASTTSKILKGAPGAPDGRPKSMREAVNVQSIKDEVIGAVRSGNPRGMKRVDDTIAKRISDLIDLRGTAGKEVDAQIKDALPVLKKAQMYLRDKKLGEDAYDDMSKEIDAHAEKFALKGKDLEKYVGRTVTVWMEGSSNEPYQSKLQIEAGNNGQGVTIQGEYYGPEDFVDHNSAADYSWKSQQAAEHYADLQSRRDELDEAKKDACYNKVRSRYKVWPSAYASGALVQCRKKGAKNWGNKSKK